MLTDPSELVNWYMTKSFIVGCRGGKMDLTFGPGRIHVTGRILTWDPPSVLEHEWKVSPREHLPAGENSVIRWELHQNAQGTYLDLQHRRLSRETASSLAPCVHVLLDRLEKQLNQSPLPKFTHRLNQVSALYSEDREPQPARDSPFKVAAEP